MKSQEIFEEIQALVSTFEQEHNGKSKAAKQRARKALSGVKGLISEYRKASISENK